MSFCEIDQLDGVRILRLISEDGTNRLTRHCVLALSGVVSDLAKQTHPLVIAGNSRFFSVGADLNEIAALSGPDAYEFSRLGQKLMNSIERFPAPVGAAISGYCMGGGLDLALACHLRIAAPNAIFGHRGAALGLITGWGGTQRLPRLIGRARGLEMFITAERIRAEEAFHRGLIDRIAEDPIAEACARISTNQGYFA